MTVGKKCVEVGCIKCCGLQIRPVEEQLKQQVKGKRYCISRKRKSKKEVLAVLGMLSVCQMSRKEQEVVSPEWAKLGEYVLGWTSPFWGYGRICPHHIKQLTQIFLYNISFGIYFIFTKLFKTQTV